MIPGVVELKIILLHLTRSKVLCFVDRTSRYERVKKNQLDAQLILSIFRQPLHVSGISMPIIRRYNRMYTTICTCTYRFFLVSLCLQANAEMVPKFQSCYYMPLM